MTDMTVPVRAERFLRRLDLDYTDPLAAYLLDEMSKGDADDFHEVMIDLAAAATDVS